MQPFFVKVNGTLDKVNGELARVEDTISTVREVSERIQITMRIAQDIVSSPLIKVASFSTGTKEALKKLISRD